MHPTMHGYSPCSYSLARLSEVCSSMVPLLYYRTNMIKLDKIQNKFVRQCVGLHKYFHVSPLLKATGIFRINSGTDTGFDKNVHVK